ncbi:MAG: radical SAM protein [Thermodesulfobacteriota bacterium]
MRILLIQPASSIGFIDQVYMHEPLALEYLGAGLKLDDHDVLLLDGRIDTDLLSRGQEFQPDIVALTGYTSQVNIIIELARKFKAISPAPFVVVGGHHATVRPVDFNLPAIDLTVIGEGVTTLREIAGKLAARQDFNAVDGLAIPGDKQRFTRARPHCSLNDLPMPDRSLTARYRSHYFSEWLQPLASIRTSLGCVGRCNFCALWSLTDGRYLKRNPEKVIEELKTINEKNVFFCDDESMCDVKRMEILADLIRENGIKKHYFLYARADTVVRHPQLFEKWRDVGLRQVFVGMESFSDSHLQAMNKGITLEQQEEAVHVLRELGIMLYASFVVDPDFSHEDFGSLTQYVRRLQLNHASFSILTPLPGTKMWEERQNDLLPYRPELFDFIHTVLPTRLPFPEFYTEFALLWQNAVPPYRALKTFSRYGLKRLPGVFRLLSKATSTMRRAHLDHC